MFVTFASMLADKYAIHIHHMHGVCYNEAIWQRKQACKYERLVESKR